MVDNNCIIEGNVKFRDGKKWKSRWCVMRKLSPVADCLHLQLYGDSKDRYKQGQTKASLSLQHFLGVQSAFTLDKESNTIAIICQDVTVVLAFDTRERLMQWQVKISNNLGEDQEFLVIISSAPAKAKLSTGPAQLHIQEQRFCMTVGVPPRLVGIWEIGHLRRYGVVEGRFCFEGGSRCGRGEGLHVLYCDQAEAIAKTLQLAAEGKMTQRRRGLGSGSSTLNCQESPRRQFGRSDTRASDLFPSAAFAGSVSFDDVQCDAFLKGDTASSYWSSAESRQDTECEADYSRSLASELADQPSAADWRSCSLARQQHGSAVCLERCSSCISKLGTISKSSTCATTTSGSTTAVLGNLAHLQPRAFDRLSLSSYSSSNSHDSDYSGSPQPGQQQQQHQQQQQQQHHHQQQQQQQHQHQQQQQQQHQQQQYQPSSQPQVAAAAANGNGHRLSPSPLALPPRPPKPSTNTVTLPSKAKKPPMPLPAEQICTCPRKTATTPTRNGAGPYENYDIPKTILAHHTLLEQPSPSSDQYYDTPRKIKECLAMPKAYPNYDTPHVPQAVVLQQCGCPAKLTPSQAPKSLACPCQNVMSWAGFVLPYCRRGAGIEPTGVTVQPVRLSGEGKMPVVNASGQLGIYNSTSNGNIMETSQSSASTGNNCECPVHSSSSASSAESGAMANYENIEPASVVIDTQPEAAAKSANYANIDFTESLCNYENSKDLLAKVGIISQEESDKFAEQSRKTNDSEEKSTCEEEDKVCHKCGHPKEISEDYLVASEDSEDSKKATSDYITMQPACSKEVLSRLCSGVKSSSNPALSGMSPHEVNRKRSESEYRVPGSAMLSSPYFRRRLLEMSNSEAGSSLGMLLRKRSYSVESAHYLDDDKSTFTPTVPIHKCSSDTDKALTNNEVADSETEANDSADVTSPSPQPLASIKIRRSSSVPSKAGHNRDSSSSNDSGVSTGSLSHRTAEFVEFEFPTTPANTLLKKQSVPLIYHKSPQPACYHNSLPRKSKSSDPLRELTFQFHKTKLPTKSSSAEADIPTCLPPKGSKEFSSPGEVPSVPYIDSRSTSSGTSDMSDYIETLSLSSHSSSDAPDNLRIGGRAVATTLRPRSGKEYYKIDRSILVEQGRTISTSSNYANVAPFTKKETHRHPVT